MATLNALLDTHFPDDIYIRFWRHDSGPSPDELVPVDEIERYWTVGRLVVSSGGRHVHDIGYHGPGYFALGLLPELVYASTGQMALLEALIDDPVLAPNAALRTDVDAARLDIADAIEVYSTRLGMCTLSDEWHTVDTVFGHLAYHGHSGQSLADRFLNTHIRTPDRYRFSPEQVDRIRVLRAIASPHRITHADHGRLLASLRERLQPFVARRRPTHLAKPSLRIDDDLWLTHLRESLLAELTTTFNVSHERARAIAKGVVRSEIDDIRERIAFANKARDGWVAAISFGKTKAEACAVRADGVVTARQEPLSWRERYGKGLSALKPYEVVESVVTLVASVIDQVGASPIDGIGLAIPYETDGKGHLITYDAPLLNGQDLSGLVQRGVRDRTGRDTPVSVLSDTRAGLLGELTPSTGTIGRRGITRAGFAIVGSGFDYLSAAALDGQEDVPWRDFGAITFTTIRDDERYEHAHFQCMPFDPGRDYSPEGYRHRGRIPAGAILTGERLGRMAAARNLSLPGQPDVAERPEVTSEAVRGAAPAIQVIRDHAETVGRVLAAIIAAQGAFSPDSLHTVLGSTVAERFGVGVRLAVRATDTEVGGYAVLWEDDEYWVTGSGARIHKTSKVSRTAVAVGDGTIIRAHATICGGVYIEDCEVGEYATIHDRSVCIRARIGSEASARTTIGPAVTVETNPDRIASYTIGVAGSRTITVSGVRCDIGPGCTIGPRSVLINTSMEARCTVEESYLENSVLRSDVQIRGAKLTMVHAADLVQVAGTGAGPIEIRESFLPRYLQLSEPCVIESTLFDDQLPLFGFDEASQRLFVQEVLHNVPGVVHVMRGVGFANWRGEGKVRPAAAEAGTQAQVSAGSGLPSKFAAAEGCFVVTPFTILAPDLRFVASSKSIDIDPLRYPLEHTAAVVLGPAVIGFATTSPVGARDARGRTLPFSLRHGLAPREESFAWALSHAPGLLLELMAELVRRVRSSEPHRVDTGEFDSYFEKAIRSGIAVMSYLISVADREEDRHDYTLARSAMRDHLSSGAWRFDKGERPTGWEFDESSNRWRFTPAMRRDSNDVDTSLNTVPVTWNEQQVQYGLGDVRRMRRPFLTWEELDAVAATREDVDSRWGAALARATSECLAQHHSESPTCPTSAVPPSSEAQGSDAKVGPHVVLGSNVKIGRGACVLGDSVIGDGVVIGDGARVIGSKVVGCSFVGPRCTVIAADIVSVVLQADSSVVNSRIFSSAPDQSVVIGDHASLTSCQIVSLPHSGSIHTTLGSHCHAYQLLLVNSSVGDHVTFEPFGYYHNVALGSVGVQGGRVVDSRIDGVCTNRHVDGRLNGVIAPDLVFDHGGMAVRVPNPSHFGGVVTGRASVEGSFISALTVVLTGATLRPFTFVQNWVGSREVVAPLSDKRGPGAGNETLGGMLQPRRAGMIQGAFLGQMAARLPSEHRERPANYLRWLVKTTLVRFEAELERRRVRALIVGATGSIVQPGISALQTLFSGRQLHCTYRSLIDGRVGGRTVRVDDRRSLDEIVRMLVWGDGGELIALEGVGVVRVMDGSSCETNEPVPDELGLFEAVCSGAIPVASGGMAGDTAIDSFQLSDAELARYSTAQLLEGVAILTNWVLRNS